MTKEQLFNEILNTAITNIYSISKDSEKIVLKGFDPKNDQHLTLLQAASIVQSLYGWPIYINMAPLRFLWYKLKNGKRWKSYKYIFGYDVDKDLYECDKLIADITEAYQKAYGNTEDYNYCTIFKEIYDEFYK